VPYLIETVEKACQSLTPYLLRFRHQGRRRNAAQISIIWCRVSRSKKTMSFRPPTCCVGVFCSMRRWTCPRLVTRLAAGAMVKVTGLSEQFDYEAFQTYYGNAAIPLFLIRASGNLLVFTTDTPLHPKPGQSVVSLVPAEANMSPGVP
jgi:hypothetical protein